MIILSKMQKIIKEVLTLTKECDKSLWRAAEENILKYVSALPNQDLTEVCHHFGENNQGSVEFW